jgi:hypothetical protein
MSLSCLPTFLAMCFLRLGSLLDPRVARRLPLLLVGILFASGRRTATTWFRAADITPDFRQAYHAIYAVGRRVCSVALDVFQSAFRERLLPLPRLVFALDDTPSARYGPHVQGAGIHRDPSPGPGGSAWLYGHVWVTLAWLGRHARWGTLALPFLAALYVRQKDVAKLPKRYAWEFRTKLTLAVELLREVLHWVRDLGKAVWIVVDGGYAKKEFLRAARTENVTVVSRLRKDAALRTLPPTARRQGRRGPMPTYGSERIDLAKRAGQTRGWQQVSCVQYGAAITKTIKTFLATWVPAGGVIRVVLIREAHGWVAFFCTDPQATVVDILELAADRSAIEQTFNDLKEVWGAGQQQLRNVYANNGAWHLNLWSHALVEWWAWDEPDAALVDRSAAPWDREERRPSHADKRRAVQRRALAQELGALVVAGTAVEEIVAWAEARWRRVA